jgi:integrator complex subunit 1
VTKPATSQTGLNTKAEEEFLSDLKSKDSHTAVRMCVKMMKDQENKPSNQTDQETLTSGDDSSSLWQPNSKKDFSGLLVDWLERLDPELSSVDLEEQMDIIFGWCKDSEEVSLPGGETKRKQKDRVWQPYLLSSLTHHCSWKTFERCLNHLLRPSVVSRFNPTAVLDVLASFLRSPRIWQGTAPIATGTESFNKNADEEISLPVDNTQACVVVDYMVEEAKDHQGEIDTIGRRLPLILSCCGKEEVLKAIIAHVHSIAQPWSDAVLVQLYLALPVIAPLLQNFSVISKKAVTYSGPSKLEPLIHRLLTRLSGTDFRAVKLECLKDTHLLCRSLAAAHPALIIRHLSFICGLLNGRLHLTPKEFETRNHHHFFTWMLGLLDLVRPLLFQCLEEVQDSFHKIIVTYMELMEKHCHPSHDRRNLVTAFLAFLCHFHASHPAKATVLLVEYKHVISELAETYPDVGQARAMLEFLSSHSLLTSSTSTEQATVVPFNLIPSERIWTLSQLTPFIKALEEDQIEGVLDVLHDMDKVSFARVGILEAFETQLHRLLKSENDECRTLAHTLLLRYIVHNPKCGFT